MAERGELGMVERLVELRCQAERVRRAIEATDLSGSGNLADFPKECCHHAVKLLAFHLSQRGWADLQKVTGTRNTDPSCPHFWLLAGPILIDITADQFAGEGQPSVIVTFDSPWHEGWDTTYELLARAVVLSWPSMTITGFDAYRKVMTTLAVLQ